MDGGLDENKKDKERNYSFVLSSDPVRIISGGAAASADPLRIGLTQSRPARWRGPRLFHLSALASELARYQMKKPARLRLVGFVTPSGFKPETY
jgi:hypothetical protein